jgi:uncharacterized membrane protein YidH (DUF202 family)
MASGEVRAANAINVTMFTLLAFLFFGFAIWEFAQEISPVGVIYRSLSAEQQRHLTSFGSSVLVLAIGIRLASGTIADWLKRRRAS